MKKNLPEWLRLWFQSALISNIYSEIRAIAVGFSDNGNLTVRYYLSSKPTDFDYENISIVVDEILSNTNNAEQIRSVKEECYFSEEKIHELDHLDGLVFARREVDTNKL